MEAKKKGKLWECENCPRGIGQRRGPGQLEDAGVFHGETGSRKAHHNLDLHQFHLALLRNVQRSLKHFFLHFIHIFFNLHFLSSFRFGYGRILSREGRKQLRWRGLMSSPSQLSHTDHRTLAVKLAPALPDSPEDMGKRIRREKWLSQDRGIHY